MHINNITQKVLYCRLTNAVQEINLARVGIACNMRSSLARLDYF
jgi:hypothetical protein